MKPESKFWNYLKDKMPLGSHATRIENTAGNGMPDVNIVIDGIEIWVELKVFEKKYLIRKEQRVWGFHHSRGGGKAFVVFLCQGMIEVWKHPNIIFVKHDGTYQRIDCPPHFVCRKDEVQKLLEFMLFGAL